MSILVVGAGEIGYHVARRLSLEKKDVTVIDCDPEKVKKVLDNLDVEAIRAGGSSPLALRQAGIADAEMIIAVTNSDEVNLVSCLVAGTQSRSVTSVARVRNLLADEYLNLLYDRIRFLIDEMPPVYDRLLAFLDRVVADE